MKYIAILYIVYDYSFIYSKVMQYGNGGRMHVMINGEPLEGVDCLSTWGRKWQLMEDVKGMSYTE